MCTYLDKVGATYYFRRAVPAELQPFILTKTGQPRTEFKFSLRTKDRETAKERLPAYVTRSNRELAEARTKRAATVGARHPATTVSFDPFAGMTFEQFEQQQAHEAEVFRTVAAEDHAAEEAAAWERDLPRDHHAARLLREAREERDRYRGRYHARKEREQAQRAPQDTQEAVFWRKAGSAPAVTVTSLFDAYKKQDGITDATASQYDAVLRSLVGFLGHDDAKRVTHGALVGWLDHLQVEPVQSGKAKGKPRSVSTINQTYLGGVRSVFAYARGRDAMDTNPAAELQKLRAAKKQKLREKDFTRAERKTILSAALEPVTARIAPKGKSARRWIPWLCAYSGARVNEMSQLRKEDVRKVDGIWAMLITPEAGTTKTQEARTVPLHEHLVEQGFIAFVEASEDGPLFYDPGTARTESSKRHYKKVGERLAAWVREELSITDPAILPNHAWRHTFKGICREVGIEEQASDAITGHAGKTVGRTYGPHTVKATSLQLSKFPRYNLEE